MKQVNHYFSGCIGCGACTGIAPQAFNFNNETFKAELINGQLQTPTTSGPHPGQEFSSRTFTDEELDQNTAELAAGSCCAAVIEITEIETE